MTFTRRQGSCQRFPMLWCGAESKQQIFLMRYGESAAHSLFATFHCARWAGWAFAAIITVSYDYNIYDKQH